MNKTAKIFVTIGIVFVFLLLFGILNAARTASGYKTPGFLGVILLAAVIGSIRAIWKKDKDNNSNSNSILQK